MVKPWLFGLSLFAFTCPLVAYAADPIEEITVTATRIPTPTQKIPAGVTILTQQDFKQRGETTLVDALTSVPGLGVVQSGGPGGQASVFIRGTNSEDVLVLLNGVPVNDPSDANGAFNFGDYTLSDVERIEVIRGAMSGLYGSNAIGGVINIITIKGEGAPKASVTLGGGYPAQGQASATISGSSGKFDYALSGAIDEEAGFDYTAKRLSVYANHQDSFRSKLGSVNLGYSPDDTTRIYLNLRAQQVDNGFPNLGFPVFDDPNEYDHNANYFGKLGVTKELFNGALTTDLFIARLENNLQFNNLFDAADPNGAAAHDVYRGYRTDAQWNNTVHLPNRGNVTDASLTFGIEYSNDTSNEAVNESNFGFPFVETVHSSQHAIAGHAGLQGNLFNRLILSAAVRDDAVSSFGNAFTGRVGGVLLVPEADMRIKASFGTGFLAPSLFELYGVSNFGYVGNPKLRAEYSSGGEVGPQFDIPAFGQVDYLSISASYFQTAIRDLITSTPDFSSEQNIGRANTSGVETEVVWTPTDWLKADLNYTYTRAVNAESGSELLRRPQNAGSATVTITPVAGFSIVPQVQYIGRFVDFLYDNNGFPIGNGRAAPGTIVNLSANYRLSDKFTVFANGKNILNSNFEPANGLQIAGASVLVGIRAEFQ